jgi:hypothetical protein
MFDGVSIKTQHYLTHLTQHHNAQYPTLTHTHALAQPLYNTTTHETPTLTHLPACVVVWTHVPLHLGLDLGYFFPLPWNITSPNLPEENGAGTSVCVCVFVCVNVDV